MRFARTVVATIAVGFGLACSGLPLPSSEVEPAVQELLDAERGDDAALEGEARDARVLTLEAFLAATPDFADWKAATIDCLRGDCAESTEAAYARVKTELASRPGDAVTIGGEPWRLLVLVERTWDAPHEWDTSSSEVAEALADAGVVWVEAGPGVTSVPVTKDGATPLATVDFGSLVPEKEPKVGYVFAKSGADPVFHEQGAAADVRTAACAYFEIPCDGEAAEPEPAEPEPAEPEPEERGPSKGKGKAWRPGPR